MPSSSDTGITLSSEERLALQAAYEWQFEGRRRALWNSLQGEEWHPLDCNWHDLNSSPLFLGSFRFTEPKIINPVPAYLVKAELHDKVKDRDTEGVLLSLESDGLIRLPELRVYQGGTWQLSKGCLLFAKLTTHHRGRTDSGSPNTDMRIERIMDRDSYSIQERADAPYVGVEVLVFSSEPPLTPTLLGEVVYEYHEWPLFPPQLAIEVTPLGKKVAQVNNMSKAVGGEDNIKKPKSSTVSGDARIKLISALSKHHKYAENSCMNYDPIGNNELARQAKVSPSTASGFFKAQFGGYSSYRARCQNGSGLIALIKWLNGDFSPRNLYDSSKPAKEESSSEDE